MPSSVSGQDEPNPRTVIGYLSGQDGAILPARYTGFVPQVYRSCFGVFSHIVNPILTKLARSRWLDIGQVLFLRVSITSQKKITWPISSRLDLTLGQ